MTLENYITSSILVYDKLWNHLQDYGFLRLIHLWMGSNGWALLSQNSYQLSTHRTYLTSSWHEARPLARPNREPDRQSNSHLIPYTSHFPYIIAICLILWHLDIGGESFVVFGNELVYLAIVATWEYHAHVFKRTWDKLSQLAAFLINTTD